MSRPLIVGAFAAAVVVAAIVATFFIEREPDSPSRVTSVLEEPAAGEKEPDGGKRAEPPAAAASSPKEASAPPAVEGGSRKPVPGGAGPSAPVKAGPRAGVGDAGTTGSVSSPPPSGSPPAARETGPRGRAPSFDVVRTAPTGETVVAGRAAPGATVTVEVDGRPVGREIADRRGEWVIVPDEPLAPGPHSLTLSSGGPDGARVEGEQEVVVVVPEKAEGGSPDGAAAEATALVVAVPKKRGRAPVVLQKPAAGDDARVAVEAVGYGEEGQDLVLSGRATPGSELRVYLDEALVGRTKTGETGRWETSPDEEVARGLHRLRVDEVDSEGKVVARVELPLLHSPPPQGFDPEETVIVQPGNSLWRIARANYGRGIHYLVIYGTNRGQIRDPDLIYPGQVFVLPEIN